MGQLPDGPRRADTSHSHQLASGRLWHPLTTPHCAGKNASAAAHQSQETWGLLLVLLQQTLQLLCSTFLILFEQKSQ